jgi:tRNA(fMet)-specific endonuclease VapC
MILLDTDHLTVLCFPEDKQYPQLSARLAALGGETAAVTVVSVEESLRGWLAEINRKKDVHQQIVAYDRLPRLIHFFARWQILPLDSRAADEFKRLRKQKVRIGTMDLKIASIALANGALLLSANERDYRKVPGLRIENWLGR